MNTWAKCKVCGCSESSAEHGLGTKAHEFLPRTVEQPKRLTIETELRSVHQLWFAYVYVDDNEFHIAAFQANFEPEARAAAQAYVDELIKHFREGGE